MPATKKTTLDIAQRIAEAVNRKTVPTMTSTGKLNPKTDTLIGSVPEHLRHLHNLLAAVGKETRTAEEIFRNSQTRQHIVLAVFFEALETHVPYDSSKFSGVKLCEDWKVAAYKRDDLSDLFGEGVGLEDLLGILGGAHRRN